MSTYRVSPREMEMGGKYLDALQDSTDLLGDGEALRVRMAEQGYLLLRGVQNCEKVEAVRRMILEKLDARGKIDRSRSLMDGYVSDDRPPFVYIHELRTAKVLFDLVESAEILSFFENFLGGEVFTFNFKWVRPVGANYAAPAHYDIVYMGRGTHNLYTCWTPLGHLSLEQGPLMVLEGSHNLPSYERIRETYGRSDVDRDGTPGEFSHDPVELVDRYGGKWLSSEFEPGDILIFGMFMMHASLPNRTSRYRLSCDTRYQLASEPIDERHRKPITEEQILEKQKKRKTPMTIEEARTKWGI